MTSLPPHPPAQKKAFVAYVDTNLGNQIVSKLVAADYDVSGLARDGNAALIACAPKLKKLLRRHEVEAIRRALLEADCIVYHTMGSAEDTVSAIRVLSSSHYETEKRFILISSMMSWFETPSLTADGSPVADGEDPREVEALTEDQFNRRVPHVKYLAWRDAEKLVASSQTDRLKTFVVFPGLTYGSGEDLLHPFFKQAWTLTPEGLPVFGTGQQMIPTVHVADLLTFLSKLLSVSEELPDIRYLFAVDDGSCNWSQIVNAINASLGNGKVFRVPFGELGLHDNIEHFTVDLKVEAGYMKQLLADDSDWVARGGFLESIESVCQEYRVARGVTPVRICLLGPPSVGKSYAAREIAQQFRIPHFTIADVIADYKFQEVELQDEVLRIKQHKASARRQDKVDEKRITILNDRRAARQEALSANDDAASSPKANADDADDVEDEDDIEVVLTPDEEKELVDAAAADDDDEAIVAINEKLIEVKRVLAMRLKPIGVETVEAANPKDKKAKPAPKAAVKGKAADSAEPKEDPNAARDAHRLSDRSLAFMLKWKLSRVECRNQGWILDGFPKTVRQARLLFEDVPVEVPEDPDEPDMPLDKEEKPCSESLLPEFLFHCKASDTFLLERLQKTQHEHPHNTPEDFQRRLEHYKQNFDVPVGVIQYLESAKSGAGRAVVIKSVDLESAPLIPPPPPKSPYAAKVTDPTVQRLFDVIGRPRNFGPTPGDAFAEAERARLLAAEAKAEQAAQAKLRSDKDSADVAQAEASKAELLSRVSNMKDVERQMLEQRKAPLKAYLMANVIPILTKGLIEVCNRRPEDPVDFLAEWLFKHNPEDHPEMYS